MRAWSIGLIGLLNPLLCASLWSWGTYHLGQKGSADPSRGPQNGTTKLTCARHDESHCPHQDFLCKGHTNVKCANITSLEVIRKKHYSVVHLLLSRNEFQISPSISLMVFKYQSQNIYRTIISICVTGLRLKCTFFSRRHDFHITASPQHLPKIDTTAVGCCSFVVDYMTKIFQRHSLKQ